MPVTDLDEEQRLIEAAKRDPEAFAALYDRYFERIYNYAYRLTGNQDEAEDVTAQTFKQAFENIGRFEWRGVSAGAWLYRIAGNVVAGTHRRSRPSAPFEDALEVPNADPTPEDVVVKHERYGELMNAVRTLPPTQQQVLVLRFGEGLSYQEIGLAIQRSEGAVKQLIHRALVNLRGTMNTHTMETARG